MRSDIMSTYLSMDFLMRMVEIGLAIPFGLATGGMIFIMFHNVFLTKREGFWLFSPLKDIFLCFVLAIITYALLT